MDLAEALLSCGRGDSAESFEIFSRDIDPEWIESALRATRAATVRRRKLPADYVVWIVIGMGLLRDRSIQEVVRHLNLVLQESGDRPSRRTVTSGAVVQARDRLGWEPLAAVFAQTADQWASQEADADRWHGLVVHGVDGTTLRVPDTEENATAFGRPRTGRGDSAYPQVRLVALMVLRSHLLADLRIGSFTQSEPELAAPLWDKLPDSSLTIMDRGFYSFALFHRIQSRGHQRHWLCRARPRNQWTVVQSLGPGDELVELTVSRSTRIDHPETPRTLRVRAIRYQQPGFRPQTLLTSLLDPAAYPAAEVAALYHERWEIEIGFDEVKTHTLERQETLRCRHPERLRQEVWGLAIGYNLVRLEMARVARKAGVPPRRISFRHSLLLIRAFWISAWLSPPGLLPRRLESLHDQLQLLILPERRSRRYPRAVKIKLNPYPRKRPAPGKPHAN